MPVACLSSPELQELLRLSCTDPAIGIPRCAPPGQRYWESCLLLQFEVGASWSLESKSMQVPAKQRYFLPDETGAGPNAQQPYSQPPAAQQPFQQQPLLCSKCRFARSVLTGSCEICGAGVLVEICFLIHELVAVCILGPLPAMKVLYVGSKGYRRFLTLEMFSPVLGGKMIACVGVCIR